jgi:hypothetical protein
MKYSEKGNLAAHNMQNFLAHTVSLLRESAAETPEKPAFFSKKGRFFLFRNFLFCFSVLARELQRI